MTIGIGTNLDIIYIGHVKWAVNMSGNTLEA